MIKFDALPNDLSNVCLSYLTNDEMMYYENKWDEINKNKLSEIAATNGWLDLLIWAKKKYIIFSDICSLAASNGHLEVIKWAIENRNKCKTCLLYGIDIR